MHPKRIKREYWTTSLILALSLVLPVEPHGQTDVRLLRTGTFFIDPPRIEPNENWLALRGAGTKWALVRVVPRVTVAKSICGSRAAEISVDGMTDSLILIGGAGRLSEGSVTATVHSPRFLYPGEAIDISVRPRDGYWLHAFGRAIREVGGAVFVDYELWILRRRQDQSIASFERSALDNPRKLLWAGDIDRDLRPDLLFDFPHGDVGSNYVLFLSSAAAPSQFVAQVAAFSIPGC